MAAASLVATAFGVLLILITAYILAAGILGLATTVSEAQKEMTAMSVKITSTSLSITSVSMNDTLCLIDIENTGSEIIAYEYTDVYLKASDSSWDYFSYNQSAINKWSFTNQNPETWVPGETINITVYTSGDDYTRVQVTTAVGVSASHSIP
jgi:flagellar protein FlaF